MFFIVNHSWRKEDKEIVNVSLANLFRKAQYGLLGDPWPKMINFWIDPGSLQAFSLWEAQKAETLQERINSIEGLISELRQVKQLYPPHYALYNMMDIEKSNPWQL